MRAIDNGIWHEVTEDAYRAFLKDHPRRPHLKALQTRDDVWVIYDVEVFESSTLHAKTKSEFKVAYRWRVDGVMRFWIPTDAVPVEKRVFLGGVDPRPKRDDSQAG